jgi:hypothetical protein
VSRSSQPPWLLHSILVVYGLLTLVLTLRHEPWRDEADSWLVARDLPLANFIEWTRSIGTPGLWHLLVSPLARTGMPYATQGLLHWALIVAAAALFVHKSPFTIATKVLFLFSFYPAYQYAVIARSYALGILLAFCVAALYPTRFVAPLRYAIAVALLCNANPHSSGIAGAVMAAYGIELLISHSRDGRRWTALMIMFCGLVLAFIQLYTPGYVVPPNVISAPWYGAFFEAAARGFLPWFESELARLWAIAVLALVLIAIRRSLPSVVIFVLSHVGLALIFTYLWIGGFRHFGLVLVVTVLALWIALYDGAEESRSRRVAVALLNVSLVLSIPMTLQFARADFTEAFSGSKEMAQFILRNGLENAEIAAHPPAHAEAVLAYLPKKTFWYAALGEPGSYMKWDRNYQRAMAQHSEPAAAATLEHYGERDWLFLTSRPLANPAEHGLTLVYQTRGKLIEPRDAAPLPNDEKYWLYRHARVGTNG